MSTFTPNYNLEKPDNSDQFGLFRQLFNDNMDKIDNISGGSGKILKNQTLNFVGLVATISDADFDTDSDFAVYYYNEQDAEDAGIVAESSSGMVTFTATTAPQNTITCDIVIFSASGGGGGGSSTLAGLNDVDINTPADGEILTFDSVGGEWVNAPNKPYAYSLTERVVGTWLNKPLYEVVIPFSGINLSANSFYGYDISSYITDPEIVFLIKDMCYYIVGTAERLFSEMTYESPNVYLKSTVARNNISGHITVHYTKTTD